MQLNIHPVIRCFFCVLCFFPGQWFVFLVFYIASLFKWSTVMGKKQHINKDIVIGEISYFFSAVISVVVALGDERIRKKFIELWSVSWIVLVEVLICVSGLFLLGKIKEMIVKKCTLSDIGSPNIKPQGGHSVIFTCCVAPIAEEVIFRAIVLMTIADYAGNGCAVILTALLFALMHLKPKLILKSFGAGLILGLVTVISSTIIVAIVIHMILNYSSMYRSDIVQCGE